jgi:hypothetical protein
VKEDKNEEERRQELKCEKRNRGEGRKERGKAGWEEKGGGEGEREEGNDG